MGGALRTAPCVGFYIAEGRAALYSPLCVRLYWYTAGAGTALYRLLCSDKAGRGTALYCPLCSALNRRGRLSNVPRVRLHVEKAGRLCIVPCIRLV